MEIEQRASVRSIDLVVISDIVPSEKFMIHNFLVESRYSNSAEAFSLKDLVYDDTCSQKFDSKWVVTFSSNTFSNIQKNCSLGITKNF